MKRPADQAKLLFLYLLRSSAAALATPHKGGSAVSPITSTTAFSLLDNSGAAAAAAQQYDHHRHHILRLRRARRTDVASIQRCNLATLPENYNIQFYHSHMRQWPDLCLVAEDVTNEHHSQLDNEVGDEQQRQQSLFQYNGFPGLSQKQPEPKIVAYVLGKVEEKIIPPFAVPNYRQHSSSNHGQETDRLGDDWYNDSDNGRPQTELLGHVTSLAVLEEHRRQGLAAALMAQLHFHLQDAGCSGVGLHVRTSNCAAARLYENDGYHVLNVIPHYYQDGEDAYFMRKELCPEQQQERTASSTQGLSSWSPWQRRSGRVRGSGNRGRGRIRQQQEDEGGKHPFALPRDLVVPRTTTATVTNTPSAHDEQEPQISISGTL